MKQDRLTGLALLSVHNSTQYLPSTREVKEEFLKKTDGKQATLILTHWFFNFNLHYYTYSVLLNSFVLKYYKYAK